jgi:hypothetical protein
MGQLTVGHAEGPSDGPPEWSVVVFSSRESAPALYESLRAVIAAVGEVSAVIDVVINGNPSLGTAIGAKAKTTFTALQSRQAIRVWSLRHADKAHAWNEYLHTVRPESALAFFVDGSVRVVRGSFAHIARGLASTPEAIAASAVLTTGRSAASLNRMFMRYRWLLGGCYAIRGQSLTKMRREGLRHPLGIYRIDGLLCSLVKLDMDPPKSQWAEDRILVVPEAHCEIDPLRWYLPSHIIEYFKRLGRQAWSTLENKAIRWMLLDQKRPVSSWPCTIDDWLLEWMGACPGEAAAACFWNPLTYLQSWQIARNRLAHIQNDPPALVMQT